MRISDWSSDVCSSDLTTYQIDSFVPIGLTARTTMILVARKDDPRFPTFEKFLQVARSPPAALHAGHAGPGPPNHMALLQDRTSVRSGKRVAVRVDLGGRRIINKKQKTKKKATT